VVPDGLGVEIDASSWTQPAVFDWLEREGAVARPEMWRTFNCGLGFVLVVAADAVAGVDAALDGLGLAHWTVGRVGPARGERVRIG
jgi:phosphoribosylformylglycinamidine cyclo-ligase